MGLGSLQSSPFLDLGFMMLTEGEPRDKLARLSSPSAHPPDSSGHGSIQNHLPSQHLHEHSMSDMPVAFPDRGGPPPLSAASIVEKRRSEELEMSCESPEGSNLSGSDTKYSSTASTRKQREFIPENRKDQQYWEKRRKNNEAARRSREKRRLHDMVLENRIMTLEKDNSRLRSELCALKKRFGLPTDRPYLDPDAGGQDGLGLCASPSPPPPVTHSSGSMKGGNLGGISSYSSPPPLLAVSTPLPVTMHQVAGMTGVFPPQPSCSMSYYIQSGNLENHHVAGSQGVYKQESSGTASNKSQSQQGLHKQQQQQQQAFDMVVKREPEDESFNSRMSAKQETFTEESGGGHPRSRYSHYHPVTPPGIGGLSASATAAAAAAHYMSSGPGSFPPPHYGHYTPQPWQRSPMSSHSSDEASDEPLQLTVHKRSSEDDSRDADSGREGDLADRVYHADRSSGESSNGRYTNGPNSPPHSSLPVKLRHKIPMDAQSSYLGIPGSTYAPHPFVNGLAQLSEIALAQASPLSLVKKDSLEWSSAAKDLGSSRGNSSSSSRSIPEMKHLDPKYLERRRRNNEAARKCRENRKNLTRLREAKSDYLESENGKLRNELESLQEEMKQLRELLDKKRLEQGLSTEPSHQQALTEQRRQQLHQLELLERQHLRLKQEQHQLEQRQHEQRQRHAQEEEEDEENEFQDDRKDAVD